MTRDDKIAEPEILKKQIERKKIEVPLYNPDYVYTCTCVHVYRVQVSLLLLLSLK